MKRFLMLAATLTVILSTSASGQSPDSLVLSLMFGFRKSIGDSLPEQTTNVYMKHLYQTHRRNATLWTVPTLYTIAGGRRAFVCEEYGRLTSHSDGRRDYRRQAYYTTIPRQRSTMSILFDFVMPSLYGVTLYGDHILSPFNRENRTYYRYAFTGHTDTTLTVAFRPRFVRNTQLVKGKATVDSSTGRIIKVSMEGEFDMLRFTAHATLGSQGASALRPMQSETHVEFKFMGNKVSSHFVALFDCPTTLPDTADITGDRHLIDSLRPIPLTDEERYVYAASEHRQKPEQTDTLKSTKDTIPQKPHHNYLKEIAWDIIGENLIHSIRARTNDGNGYLKLSPILNPQYISYSHSKGFSYKMRLGARYSFSPSVSIESDPYVGYNFKLREVYWEVPARFKYNSRLNARLDFAIGISNRIGNNSVLKEIRDDYGDRPELDNKKLDLFDDHYIRLFNVLSPADWLILETGVVYHNRHSLNPREMEAFGKPTRFTSIAPSLGVKLQPWKKGPTMSIDYERGIKAGEVNMTYERWEADMSLKHRMKRLQTLNMRLGGGLYTTRGNNYFMDYANFRDNNIPEGWDDDWSGHFQLLSSDLYNASDYYLRGNISYETPLLAAALIPLVGRYVERERFYWSGLLLANTRMYSELGYSFTCRFASVAFFASFFNTTYQEFGSKFTFELFRRW